MAETEDFRPGTFDGAAVWATLAPDQQAEIGARALEFVDACEVLNFGGYADVPLAWARAGEASMDAAQAELENCVDTHVGQEAMYDQAGRPLVPSVVGMFCRRCGCSQYDACDEGCGWAEPYLCTACAGPAVEAASEAVAS
jgi:hypothetical protein